MSYIPFTFTSPTMSSPLRLSQKQALILDLLVKAGDSYGLELVRDSDGGLKRGTVYITLDRMETRGLVESWTEDSPAGHRGPPRRKYKATGLGEASLASWVDRLVASFGGIRLASTFLVASPLVLDVATWATTIFSLVALSAIPALAYVLYNSAHGGKVWNLIWAFIKRGAVGRAVVGWDDVAALDRSHQRREWLSRASIAELAAMSQVLEGGLLRFYGYHDDGRNESALAAIEIELQSRKGVVLSALLASLTRPWTVHPLLATDQTKPISLETVPAARLMAVIEFVMPRRWVERRLSQTYADELTEYYDDLRAGKDRRASWVRMRVVARICLVLLVSVPQGIWDHLARQLSTIVRSPD